MGEVLFESNRVVLREGLEGAVKTESEVVDDVGTVVISEETIEAEVEGLAVIVQVVEIVSGALGPSAAALWEGLKEFVFCRFKQLTESNFTGGSWVTATAGLWVMNPGEEVVKVTVLLAEAILWGDGVMSAKRLPAEVGAELTSVLEEAVVGAEVELGVD